MDPVINPLLLTTFFPLVGVVVILLLRSSQKAAVRWTALITSLITFGFSLGVLAFFDASNTSLQMVSRFTWLKISGMPIEFYLGVDGLSILMVLLTTFLTPIAILSTWTAVQERVKGFMAFFLLLEMGMLGVFLAQDLVLFYIFWEFTLVPMYFLIGVWGGERRIYAAVKFFLFTMAGSVLMLLAILFLVYAQEIREARRSGNWDAVVAGAAIFAADFVNETLNSWIFALTGYSALWVTPGPTALRTLIGWNAEIMFMFAIVGIIYYKTVDEDPRARILGLPNRWFWALGYSAFCVLVETVLNKGGHLVWDYPFWNRAPLALLPIFVFGYLWFFLAAKFAIERPTLRAKAAVPAALLGVAVLLNVVGRGLLGLRY